MKRELNGFEICIGHTAEEALNRRKESIVRDREIQRYIEVGMDRESAIIKWFSDEIEKCKANRPASV